LKQPNLTVLSVSALDEDHVILRHIFSHSNWQLHCVGNVTEAVEFVRKTPVSVVICERDLPDGNWKDMLSALMIEEPAPVLIVTSRAADDYLWAEVLNLGGGDVLAKPFEAKEVFWSVSMGWNDWKLRCRQIRLTSTQPALA
jgi:DNA-binding response OmpR family regulator